MVNYARAVVLACGGAGQVFSHTTNPDVATGDGHAMAYRAGAVLRDMEFMQFHPTALHSDENPTLLLTEALRGEGAYLLDGRGERFMVGVHERAELAPRDVVVRRMREVMDAEGSDHVYLDARHLPCGFLEERFPTVFQGLAKRGYDLCHDLVPVSPASHYYIGGVATDNWGKTSLPGSLLLRRERRHRGPRREPVGLELAAGGAGLRGSHRARPESVSGEAPESGAAHPARSPAGGVGRQRTGGDRGREAAAG